MNDQVLEIKDLSLKIGETEILRKISLNVRKGETVGLIGPNGSGKTTLFNTLSGFLKPYEGSIVFSGKDISAMPAHERSLQGIGRVFQNSGVFKEMSLYENMLLALERKEKFCAWLSPAGRKQQRAKISGYLEQIGLQGKLEEKASSLSGGQLRLLEIIRAVAFGAELFLLDEPTAGVSPKMKDEVAATIQKLKQLGKTILIIEHDMNFIQSFSDRVVVLVQGQVAMQGTPAEVRTDPRLQDIYFGTTASHP